MGEGSDTGRKVLKKGIKREILIFLGMIADGIWAQTFRNQLRRMAFDGWYQKSNFASSISKLLSVGDIEKVEKKGKVFLRLTSQGNKHLTQSIPFLKFARKQWDGYWRIVIFDINEKSRSVRNSLREKLVSLGFGQWQRSVYITPHDISGEITQFLKSKRLLSVCVCLEARQIGVEDEGELAEKVWQLNDLNEAYYSLFLDCQNLLSRVGEKKSDRRQFHQLWLAYQEIICRDPYLPRELLPKNWWAEKAQEILKELMSSFAKTT
ncbi:PaaX family transcriptional regulator C-terminal domain-containing protein [Patescibacteria group bacterium]